MTSRAALLLATLALIAGCGGEDGGGGGGEHAALEAAANRTKDIESFQMDFTIDAEFDGEKLLFEGGGTSNADSTRGRTKGTLDVGTGAVTIESITDGDVTYLKGKGLGAPPGKWLRTTTPPASTLSPVDFVGFLGDSADVEEVGAERIRDVMTTHYRGRMSLEELAAGSGPAVIERLSQSPEAGKFDVTADVWVSDDGLPWRLALKISDDGPGRMLMIGDIFEYDVPLNADPPPKSKIVGS